ncbi:MAG: TonB-dependent receptor [Phycisphaerae bacterium]|nr:TonB-dependent receptor [Phycisphaerae bacterium]
MAKEKRFLFVSVLTILLAFVPDVLLSEQQANDVFAMSLEELMNVEITSSATLTKTKQRLVPAAITTITDEQIRSSGARSLDELLDIYVPNLQLIRHHWGGDHIGLRGIYGENKYLLLVNGRVMNERTQAGAVSERDLVMLSDIHHVEVVRGPGSAMYGPGAISMVINIITYNADTFQGTEVTSRMGAIEEFYATEFKHGRRFDSNDGGFFLYGGIGRYIGADQDDAPQIYAFDFPSQSAYSWAPTDTGPASLPADGQKAGKPLTNPAINRDGADHRNLPPLKLHAQITKGNWDIWVRYTRGGKQFTSDIGPLARYPFGWADWMIYKANTAGYQQITGYIGYKQELTDNLNIDYAFSYDMFDYERAQAGTLHHWDVTDAFREDKYYGKALLRWQPNDHHKIAFGAEILRQEYGLKSPSSDVSPRTYAFMNHNMIDPPAPDDATNWVNPYGIMPRWSTNMYSLVGEHQWTINDKWTTFIGARLDRHTYTSWMFSPRAAIVHTPTEKDTFKLMWARSVRSNYDGAMRANYDSSGGDSDPEKLDSIELRYERQHNKNLDLAASCFVHYSLQVVDWSQTDYATIPVGTQRDYGFELEATYHTEKTRLQLSHSYTKLYGFYLADPTLVTYITSKPYGYGDDLAQWANHLTKLVYQRKLNDQWTFDASLRVYWGFPGMKDFNKYYPYARAEDPTHSVIEDGWEKAYRGNYYLNLGLQYKPNKDLTVGITGYNLLGIFNKDFNKRNYLNSYGDYRSYAPALGVSLTYKF